MIKSMTGFGQVSADDGKTQTHIEIKSLNSKFLDLNLRLPKVFLDREMEVRNLVSEMLERGKVSLTIEFEKNQEAEIEQLYNDQLFVAYYQELKRLADKVVAPYENLFQLALSSPNVIKSGLSQGSSDEEWKIVRAQLVKAISQCDKFRSDEGKTLELMLRTCSNTIGENLDAIRKLDPKRIDRIRERLRSNVVNFLGVEGYDPNRLEQEIIFYIEKLDINEEKVRLQSHLEYFVKALGEPQSNGKKLGFIAQEIGREINTIGSKANDAEIQKHVVVMKEDLEKIKEQLNNVL